MKIYFSSLFRFGTNIMRIFDINNKTAKMEIEKFIENYREAFGEAAGLPVVSW